LIKRINKIDHYFNLLIKWITNKYSNKIIIIGYNDNWKNKVALGRTTNRKFYSIPYKRFLDKLSFKCEDTNCQVILNNESYTSKCDALACEPVKQQSKYLGARCRRGLFSSSIGKLINADLNGSNFQRKLSLTQLRSG